MLTLRLIQLEHPLLYPEPLTRMEPEQLILLLMGELEPMFYDVPKPEIRFRWTDSKLGIT